MEKLWRSYVVGSLTFFVLSTHGHTQNALEHQEQDNKWIFKETMNQVLAGFPR